MATPRKRYFRVADSILREPWDRDTKLTLVLLMAYLNTRWARDGVPDEEAGRALLCRADVAAITGRLRPDIALKSLRSLAEVVSMTVESRGEFTLIDWPKFAEFQEYASRSRGSQKPNESPLQSESESESISNPQKEEKKKTPPAPRSCVCPEWLSAQEAKSASDWAAGKGFTSEQLAYAWERVRDWSQSKQLKRADWLATLRNAMTDGWALKGFGQSPSGEIESPAQAKARRTKEAGAKAYEMIQARKQQLGLMEIEGGTR